MRRRRSVALAALCALMVSGSLVLLTASPADARKVGNAGSDFVLRVQQGFLRVKGTSFDFNDETRVPQCSDGINNDDGQDTAVDYPADTQCASAADDSEVATGGQAKVPIQLTGGTINSNGTFSFAGASFPRQYIWVDDAPVVGSFQVNIDIVLIGQATGTIHPATGAMTLTMAVEVRASGGQLNSGCKVGPINLTAMTTGTTAPPAPNTPVSGVPYSPATGRVTLVQNSYSVPGASGCTATAFRADVNSTVNGQLGLPSAAGNNEALFLGEFVQAGADPQQGVVASFTTTPSSGPVPLGVALNAAGSSGAPPLTYQWDFTDDGTVDASGQTASVTYSTEGTKTARLRVTDADGDTAETTRTITVGPNLPPTAVDKEVNVPEDAVAFPITLQGTDPDGLPLTYARVAPNPEHGTVSCTSAACTYTPTGDYNGPDSFGFRVTDNGSNSDDGTVTINVTAVNDAPTASAVSTTTNLATPVTVAIPSGDIDGDTLTFVPTSPTGPGNTATCSGDQCTFTPAVGFADSDSFSVAVSDGKATVTVTVSVVVADPGNTPPRLDDATAFGDEDTTQAFVLDSVDDDGDALTHTVLTQPTNGTLSCSAAGSCTFVPTPNGSGESSATVRVIDGRGGRATATITILVNPVNDPPALAAQSLATPEDVPVPVTLAVTDPDGGDTWVYEDLTAPPVGTLSGNAPNLLWAPPAGASGTYVLAFGVTDSQGASASATITIDVQEVDDLPVAGNPTVSTPEGVAVELALTGSDEEGPVDVAILSGPAHGTYSGEVYTPTTGFAGTDSITYKVTSNTGQSVIGTASITVIRTNTPPVALDASASTTRTVSRSIVLSATDVDGPTGLTFAVVGGPTKGTLSGTAPNLTYTPGLTTGTDTFTFRVTDPAGATDTGTVTVTIAAGPALATKLTVGPATSVRPTGYAAWFGRRSYNDLNATLTTTSGFPIPGQTVTFSVAGRRICSAATNASGVARCSGTGPNSSASTYTGAFVANAGFRASSGTGPVS